MTADVESTMTGTQRAVLATLGGSGEFVSGEEIGAGIGVSRAAVAKAVAELRGMGYGIESSTRRGHRLVSRSALLLPSEVEDGLATSELGRFVQHYREVESTQTIARRLAEAGAPHGTLVIAETQNGGRGRLGRAYVCPAGGIWATMVVRRAFAPSLGPLISLAAGVGVAEAIRETAPGLDVMVKWPNDVLVSGRKVAGTLTEMVAEDQVVHYLLVGSGINVNFGGEELPAEVRETATTLRDQLGCEANRKRLLQAYLRRFESYCNAVVDGRGGEVLAAWNALPNTVGRRVRANLRERSFEGLATGLDDAGELIVARDDGEVEHVTAADVVHLSPLPPV